MKTVVVASHSGGAGRTTLTAHLAIASERAGIGTVAILDTDPQANLAEWWNARVAPTPQFVMVRGGGLSSAIPVMRRAGIDLLLIDTQRAIMDTVAGAAVVNLADLVLIPARPVPNDLRAVRRTMDVMLRAGKPSVLVLNAVKPRTKLTQEVISVLQPLGNLCPTIVYDRVGYADAMTSGLVAPELDPAGCAADEIAAVWDHLAGRLGRHAEPTPETARPTGTEAEVMQRHKRQSLTSIFESERYAEPAPKTASLVVRPRLDIAALRGPEPIARKNLGVRLPLEQHKALRIIAAARRLTVQDLIEALVDGYLTELGEEGSATGH